MASRAARSLTPLLRRSVIAKRNNTSALRGGAEPPLPPFQRIPQPTEKVRDVDIFEWMAEAMVWGLFEYCQPRFNYIGLI